MQMVMSQEIFTVWYRSGQALRQMCSAWRVTVERGLARGSSALYPLEEDRMESAST